MGASCCGLRRPGNSGHAGQVGAGGPGLCFPGSLSLGVPRQRGLAPPSSPLQPPPPSPNPNPGCHTFLQLLLASLSEDSSPQVTRETRRHSNRNRLVPPPPGGAAASTALAAGRARPGPGWTPARPLPLCVPFSCSPGTSAPSRPGKREGRPVRLRCLAGHLTPRAGRRLCGVRGPRPSGRLPGAADRLADGSMDRCGWTGLGSWEPTAPAGQAFTAKRPGFQKGRSRPPVCWNLRSAPCGGWRAPHVQCRT